MVLSTGSTKASDELPFHYHEALIPYESERSSFSKPAVKQCAGTVSAPHALVLLDRAESIDDRPCYTRTRSEAKR